MVSGSDPNRRDMSSHMQGAGKEMNPPSRAEWLVEYDVYGDGFM